MYKKLNVRVLNALYLASFCLTISLLLLRSKTVRHEILRLAPKTNKRRWLAMRVYAKLSVGGLGTAILWFMGVPAFFVGATQDSIFGVLSGMAIGFICFALFPVLMPMPSIMGEMTANKEK